MSDEPRYNGAEVLSRISGISKEEVLASFERAKANIAILAACAGPHVFEALPPENAKQKVFGVRYRCKTCGGEVESRERAWYERGLAHGRASR